MDEKDRLGAKLREKERAEEDRYFAERDRHHPIEFGLRWRTFVSILRICYEKNTMNQVR